MNEVYPEMSNSIRSIQLWNLTWSNLGCECRGRGMPWTRVLILLRNLNLGRVDDVVDAESWLVELTDTTLSSENLVGGFISRTEWDGLGWYTDVSWAVLLLRRRPLGTSFLISASVDDTETTPKLLLLFLLNNPIVQAQLQYSANRGDCYSLRLDRWSRRWN